MRKIRQLSPFLISKIAAGEVIERPSYAVKELIENAIDAHASEIKIYIEESGLNKIQVTDNGAGMEEEDLKESWKPHTTSKLQNEDDLHAIHSLGFRGEALASLAVVSKLTIQSKTNKQQIGFQVIVDNGKLINDSPVGMAIGTTVTAENLFSHIPARKKFLKSSQTELRHIIDVVNYFAVAYPSIHFTLTHGKRLLLDYPATEDVTERVEHLVGEDTFPFFIPLNKSESYVTMTGFVAKPQINSTAQNKQFLFVNARKVNDKLIASAVKEAFGMMLEATTYPLFILHLTIPFEMVDVNVHPRKEQVSFVNSQFIFQTIKQFIAEVLEENNLTFQNLSWKRTGVGTTKSYAGKLLKEKVLDKESLSIDETSHMLQLNKLYIVVTAKNGLVLVDQHAAHERILFEKLKKEFIKEKAKNLSYLLTKPIDLHFTQSETVMFEEYKNTLESVGFKFDKNTITHLPTLFQDRNPQELLRSLFEDLENENGLNRVDKVSEEMLAFLACRAAVKSGDLLNGEQMRKIIEDLQNTTDNITCPHGRPTRIAISTEDLNTMFKR